jgi:RimJ/RimL family protein N-acetyltransferase
MQPPLLTLVRRVRAADWPLLKTQRIAMVADTPIAYGETLAQVQARPDEHWQGKAASQEHGGVLTRLLAFTESGELAGAAGGWADETGAPRTFVVGVYIAPAHRGQGLLATLVQRIAEWSIEHGRPELVLEVARENPRAVAAYEKLGFTATGESHPHELYPEITELVMVRAAEWE